MIAGHVFWVIVRLSKTRNTIGRVMIDRKKVGVAKERGRWRRQRHQG